MANIYESEVKDATEVEEIVNPLDEAVNEKVYSNSNVSASLEDLNKPIEEPKFKAPPLRKATIQNNEQSSVKREPVNPEMKTLPKKETEMAASQAASLILNSYEWLHQLANKGLQVSEKKLNKLQAEGEINLNAMIDYDYGKKIRAGDFFQEYNEQVKDLLKVTPEFKDEVRPVLERVLAKRGIGLTDEQTLMYMFGKDIAAKAFMFMGQKTQINHMIQSIKDATAQGYDSGQPQPQPQPKRQQYESNNEYQPRERGRQRQQNESRRQNKSEYSSREESKQPELFEVEIDTKNEVELFNPKEPEEKKLDLENE